MDTAEKLIERALKRVRKRRQEQQLTQAAIASHCGINPSYVGLIERGERSPSLEVLLKMGAAVELTPVELFADASPKAEKEPAELAQIRALLKPWPAADRRAALRVLKEMDKLRS